MHAVNVVWRGRVWKRFNLKKTRSKLVSKVQSAVFQNKQPQQVIVKFFDGSTLLLFKTGKFKIMGRAITHNDMLKNACIVTRLKSRKIPVLELQTMTAVHVHPDYIHLDKFS